MTSKTRTRALALALLLSVALGACERSEVDGIGSFTPDDAAPPQHDLVSMDDCTVGEWGWVSGEGVINNGAADVSTFEVVVGFYDGERRIGDRSARIRDLAPGESATFDVYAWLDDEASEMTSCRVLTINRWSAPTRS